MPVENVDDNIAWNAISFSFRSVFGLTFVGRPAPFRLNFPSDIIVSLPTGVSNRRRSFQIISYWFFCFFNLSQGKRFTEIILKSGDICPEDFGDAWYCKKYESNTRYFKYRSILRYRFPFAAVSKVIVNLGVFFSKRKHAKKINGLQTVIRSILLLRSAV